MATLTTRGTSWVLDWSDPSTGRRHRRVIGDRTTVSADQANAALKTLEYQLATGDQVLNLVRRKEDSPLFSELCERYLDWRRAQFPDSQDGIELIVRRHLMEFWVGCDIDAITDAQAEAFVAERAKYVVPSTLNKELRTLKAVLNKAVEWKLLAANPVQYVKGRQEVQSKPREFYTLDEMKALYAAATPAYASVWQLMANTGMRRSEALALRWESVTDTTITIVSTTVARTKSRKWRHIPLSGGARKALAELRGVCGTHVLPQVTKMGLTKAFERHAGAAGLTGSLHMLRHTFASHLVMAGRPLYEVQLLLGHASIKTTQQYAHLAPGYLQDAVKGMNL